MYISIFEKNNSHKKIHNSIVLNNKIVLDIDDGNSAYGGYGSKVNFISFNNEIFHRPILISKEIKYYLKKQSHETQ